MQVGSSLRFCERGGKILHRYTTIFLKCEKYVGDGLARPASEEGEASLAPTEHEFSSDFCAAMRHDLKEANNVASN